MPTNSLFPASGRTQHLIPKQSLIAIMIPGLEYKANFPPFFRKIFSFLMRTSNFYFIFHGWVLMTYPSTMTRQSIPFLPKLQESFPSNQRSQLNRYQQVFTVHFHTPSYQYNLSQRQTKGFQIINHYDILNSSTMVTMSQTPKISMWNLYTGIPFKQQHEEFQLCFKLCKVEFTYYCGEFEVITSASLKLHLNSPSLRSIWASLRALTCNLSNRF